MKKLITNKALKKGLTLLNNKYKFEIIYYLSFKKMRFGEIKINIGTISQQMLSKLLKEMERDKLVLREKNVHQRSPRNPFNNTKLQYDGYIYEIDLDKLKNCKKE